VREAADVLELAEVPQGLVVRRVLTLLVMVQDVLVGVMEALVRRSRTRW